MADIYDEINDLEFEVVTMTDENGDAVEFSIIDNVACGGERYLLVVETELMDDDETDAIILKEVSINTDDVTYDWWRMTRNLTAWRICLPRRQRIIP